MALKAAVQGMQASAGQVHVLGRLSAVQACQLPGQLGRVDGLYARLAATLEERLQSLVQE